MIPISNHSIDRVFLQLANHFANTNPIRPLGIRDPGAIEASAARPFASFGGVEKYPDDFEKAAALMHSITQNHPYLNGNKRVALVATFSWLAASGYSISDEVPDDEVVSTALRLAAGREPRPGRHRS